MFRKMTVVQLREECGKLGLPKYQHKKKRLLKADLVAQLQSKAPLARPPAIECSERIIRQAECLLPICDEYRKAMRRIMMNCALPKHHDILNIRRLKAIERVRNQKLQGSSEWIEWQERLNIALSAIK